MARLETPPPSFDTLRLWCGCDVAALRSGQPNAPVLRTIARKHVACRVRWHRVGERVYIWELLPPPRRSLFTR